jgi:type VI secretion system protein ImpE
VTAQELFQAGRLGDAVQAMTAEVKANPTDVERRYRLFAFLCFAGELERADRQLDALGAQDPKLEMSSRVYRNLLASEMMRRQAFEAADAPMLPPGAPDHATMRKEALEAIRAKDSAAAARLLDSAAAVSPDLAGTADGRRFTSLRDADDLLASVLEVYAGGRYLWLPFERIRTLSFTAPKHVLDLLWASATLEDADGTSASIHVPALYPGSFASGVDPIRLGRATDWNGSGGVQRGCGQRILDASFEDAGPSDEPAEIPLLSLRSLELAAPGPSASAA